MAISWLKSAARDRAQGRTDPEYAEGPIREHEIVSVWPVQPFSPSAVCRHPKFPPGSYLYCNLCQDSGFNRRLARDKQKAETKRKWDEAQLKAEERRKAAEAEAAKKAEKAKNYAQRKYGVEVA
jgi:hypothetical protein